MLMRRVLPASVLVVAVACGAGSAAIGPLRIEVPDGWVATRTGNTLKISDAAVADVTETRPSAATAVFDIYIDSDHTPQTYRELLLEHNVGAREEVLEIDGYEATGFEYTGEAFGGTQYAVVIPDQRVHIVYRAAFQDDDAAFRANLGTVKRAIGSITFTEEPPR